MPGTSTFVEVPSTGEPEDDPQPEVLWRTTIHTGFASAIVGLQMHVDDLDRGALALAMPLPHRLPDDELHRDEEAPFVLADLVHVERIVLTAVGLARIVLQHARRSA